MENRKFVFDFDSTLTQVEALDILAEISLDGNPEKDSVVKKIQEITDLGIDGDISFTDSLSQRIALLKANKSHLVKLIDRLSGQISKSVIENRNFFDKYKDDIYVISCGFKEFIVPIVAEYNIDADRVYANTFKYDENGTIIGFDEDNPLAKHNGKIDCLKGMNLKGEIQVIGDGYSDYQMRKAGIADKFFAYTENVSRKKVLDIADYVTPSFDEFLYVNKLPMKISYPKNRIKVLLLEGVHEDAIQLMNHEGYDVTVSADSLSEEELCNKIKGIHIIGIRSKTKITSKVVSSADKLLAVGAFCIGTKQIDLEACKEKGIAVFNAPYSNTRSVVELAIGQIIMLMRSTFVRSSELHNGIWKKTAKGSREVRGKVLGIIGYGNIGKQLSVLAEAMGMKVIFYDQLEKLALGNAEKRSSMEAVFKESDVISLHVDDNPDNKNLIGSTEFSQMKDGVIFVNLSRGFVVDIPALVAAQNSGKVAGVAVDVYPTEPKSNDEPFTNELMGQPNTILTPHIGGSTMEAQKHIGNFVPNSLMSYVNTGASFDSVNLPQIKIVPQKNGHRFLHIHRNVSGVLAQVNNILAKYDMNITGQHLKTDEKVGYLITDVDKEYNKEVIEELRTINETIKFRLLY